MINPFVPFNFLTPSKHYFGFNNNKKLFHYKALDSPQAAQILLPLPPIPKEFSFFSIPLHVSH